MVDKPSAAQIKSQNNIVDVVSRYLSLKKIGAEKLGKCPFHNDETPSFSVSESLQIYKCFGCGDSGDVITFIQKIERLSFTDACAKLSNGATSTIIEPPKPPPNFSIIPVPDGAPEVNFHHQEYGDPIAIHTFVDINNKLNGYSLRYLKPDGFKIVLPYTYRSTGRWQFKGFDEPRPVYGAQWLTYFFSKSPNSPKRVLIVEGEKTQEHAQSQLPYPVISWHGGDKSFAKINWDVLNGVDEVYLFPDNDYTHRYKSSEKNGELMPFHEQPGNRAMLGIHEIIKSFVPVVKWVNPPSDTPCGWDVADKQWQPNELYNYIESNSHNVPVISVEPPVRIPAVLKSPYSAAGVTSEHPFSFLGFKKEAESIKYFFLSSASKLIISFSNSSINKQNILSLAPINWWEDRYKFGKTLDIDQLSEFLISESIKKGMFSESRIRGRGSWMDNGRSVLHVGDHLIVNSERVEIQNIQSKYIYEQGFPLGIKLGTPLPTSESSKIIEIFNLMNWERPINAYLLAGWSVIAPVCGALNWRPHVWITGGASTGKSWILKFCNELIGDSGYFIEGATTEPGIRRMLDHDAMPIIFDEAEAESASSQMRIQSILELARSASSENGAIVVKGSAGGGKAATSQTRTMILFGSIGMHMSQQSDRSRITVLGLNAPNEEIRKQKFERLSHIYANLINDSYTQGLKSRTISMLPTILKNSETFSRACISVLGGQRHGDQLGPLLAGAVSLEYDGEVSYEQALDWVRSKDWNEERSLDTSKDELRCFNEIMQHTVNVETDINVKVERSISELCIIASGKSELGEHTTQHQAISLLNRFGITLRAYDIGILIIIANQHKGISKILRGSPWSSGNHNKILSRMENSVQLESIRFGNSVSRAVGIPLSVLL